MGTYTDVRGFVFPLSQTWLLLNYSNLFKNVIMCMILGQIWHLFASRISNLWKYSYFCGQFQTVAYDFFLFFIIIIKWHLKNLLLSKGLQVDIFLLSSVHVQLYYLTYQPFFKPDWLFNPEKRIWLVIQMFCTVMPAPSRACVL